MQSLRLMRINVNNDLGNDCSLHINRMKSLCEISCNGKSNSSVSPVTLSYQAKICWGNQQEEGKGLWNSFQLRWLSASEGIVAEEQKETRKWCQQLPSRHERHSSHPQQQWPKMKDKSEHWAKQTKEFPGKTTMAILWGLLTNHSKTLNRIVLP